MLLLLHTSGLLLLRSHRNHSLLLLLLRRDHLWMLLLLHREHLLSLHPGDWLLLLLHLDDWLLLLSLRVERLRGCFEVAVAAVGVLRHDTGDAVRSAASLCAAPDAADAPTTAFLPV